jgi:hypothetical protein
MSADTDVIHTIKSQALQIIADITTEPKPAYQIDGQSVSWDRYLVQLQRTVDWCDAKLNGAEPFEFSTRGGT